jgi:hypothetical protein
MLILTIDIVQGGFAPARGTLASMRVLSVFDLAAVSDYSAELLESANVLVGTPARIGSCEVLDDSIVAGLDPDHIVAALRPGAGPQRIARRLAVAAAALRANQNPRKEERSCLS